MIRSLHIRNYVLIDSLDIDLPEGLAIITGQTGAGKSILLGALSLLTGTKGDVSFISEGADSCIVEADFSAPEAAKELCEQEDVDWNGGELTIRRVLNRAGRARAFVNDEPVPVQLLQDLSSYLVDIHSQHQSLKLSDGRFRMGVLDGYAGTSADLELCSAKWKEMLSLENELSSVRDRLSRLKDDREYNEARFRQLDDAHLREGELEELEAEQKQLANAESIKEALSQAEAVFEPEQSMSIDSALKEAGRLLDKVSAYLPALDGLSGRLHSSRIELADILDSISSANAGIDLSQERLDAVEGRMGELYSLMQRFGCASVAELIAARGRYGELLFDSSALEEKASELEERLASVRREHAGICEKLHAARLSAAPSLAEGIASSLHFLELENAVFEVSVTQSEPSATGKDSVDFLFSAGGGTPVSVSKCASGGELSRIMLSVKALMAQYTGMPTMIFDEIDTGVSGSAADRMGQMICGMGEHMQLLAITHLPQVAAKGNAHFVVEKQGMSSGMRLLDKEGRVREIARLLSGESITPEALANARRLLL